MKGSSKERPPIQIDAIKQAIINGTLDAQAIHQTLLAEITLELDKPFEEVDMSYVNACEELLILLNHSRAAAVVSHYDSNLQAIRKRLHKWHVPHPPFHALRLGMACGLIVLIIFGGVLLTQNDVTVTLSPDKEQLILQGQAIDDDASHADANHITVATGSYDTDDWDEAVALYGSVPKVPSWLPDGWSVQMYSIRHLDAYSRFIIVYQHDLSDDVLIFTQREYYDAELFRTEMEQNENGRVLTLSNGKQVYIATNIGLPVAEWHDNNTQCILTGALDEDDLAKSMGSIR